MFSIPLNPKLPQKDFEAFVQFLVDYKDWIYDFYFTCRISPFTQDAMGDVFTNGEEDHNFIIEMVLWLQQTTGVKASAVFNNIEVRPSQENLDLFIEEFTPVYDAGIVSATIPHTHWVATKQIQTKFPQLFIKNTILRNVSEPREIEKLAEAGFHYVNLDRDLMRDHEKLLRFKKAKEKYGIMLSLLANEGCLGGCSMMDEHYQFNNTRGDGPQYFNDPISRVSCKKWDALDPAVPLKTANFPPWREDWAYFLEELGIDVIKMHGRESLSRLRETMDIVRRYARGDEILFDGFNDFIEDTNLIDTPIDIWRKKIRTCKFDCWDCGYCDKIIKAKYGDPINPLVKKATQALIDSASHPYMGITVPGLTSERVQSLINILAKDSSGYLEIGSAQGATAAAALRFNKTINAYFVDNWKEDIEAQRDDSPRLGSNNKEKFKRNIGPYKERKANVLIFDGNMMDVDTSEISNIDFFFYDGPHDRKSTATAIQYYSGTFADNVIMLFDDANWEGVVDGADEGIRKAGLTPIFSKMMLNSLENDKEWWNGIYLVVAIR